MTDDIRTETKTIRLNYDIFESTIVSCLYALGALDDSVDVVGTDFGLPVDDNDMIEFDIEIVVPRSRPTWEPKVIEGTAN